ncbi:MAG: histidinol-phosphate transaminase [Cyclonatronaceae bacterium]
MIENQSSPASTFSLQDILRPNILRLKPYRSARDDFKEGVLLDANENPHQPAIADEDAGAPALNRYPDPQYEALRNRLAELKSIAPEQIFLGNGSDEAIDLLIRICCAPGDGRVLITPPTYGMYEVSADIQGVEVIKVPLNPDFSLSPDAVLEKASHKSAKLIFLCSPNNPTANRQNTETIRTILSGFPGLVVVDEAYIDFSAAPSLLALLADYPNLVVMQTLSKAWGLAGIRLGMAFASPELISYMMRVKPPYNVNALTQRAALRALSSPGYMQNTVDTLLAERARVAEALEKHPGVKRVFPSDANFLLVQIPGARHIYEALAKRGIIVRYRGDQMHCDDGLRITIGTAAENDALLKALNELL